MKRPVLVAAVLASAAVASAAAYVYASGEGNPLAPPSVESGARPLREAADARAAQWAEGAWLARVWSTEGRPVDGRVDPPFLFDTSVDPEVGNGRAVAWSFAYLAPGKEGRLFVASFGGDGSTLYARELPDPHYGCCVAVAHPEGHAVHAEDSTVVHEWTPPKVDFAVDADEATAAVRDRPEFRDFPLDHPAYQAFLELAPGGDGRSVWQVHWRTASHFSASAAVDAASGEVLHVYAWPSVQPPQPPHPPCSCPPPTWQPEDFHGAWQGELTQQRWWFDAYFPVDSHRHARELVVAADVEDGLPTDVFVLRVFDASGREVARDEGPAHLEARVTEFFASGTWTVVVEPRDVFLPRENAVAVTADLVYGPDVAPPPTEMSVAGSVHGWGAQWWLPLPTDAPLARALVTLAWDRTVPTDNLEIVQLDAWGNEVQSARGADVHLGADSVTIEVVPRPDECCPQVAVRNLGYAGLPVEFEVHVLLEYGAWRH